MADILIHVIMFFNSTEFDSTDVVVDSLFNFLPLDCGGSVFGPCFL